MLRGFDVITQFSHEDNYQEWKLLINENHERFLMAMHTMCVTPLSALSYDGHLT